MARVRRNSPIEEEARARSLWGSIGLDQKPIDPKRLMIEPFLATLTDVQRDFFVLLPVEASGSFVLGVWFIRLGFSVFLIVAR